MNRTAMRVENDGAHCTQGACPAHMTDMAEAVCALDRALFKLTFEISYFTARLFTHIHDTSPAGAARGPRGFPPPDPDDSSLDSRHLHLDVPAKSNAHTHDVTDRHTDRTLRPDKHKGHAHRHNNMSMDTRSFRHRAHPQPQAAPLQARSQSASTRCQPPPAALGPPI